MYSQLIHLIYFTLQCVVISSAKEVAVFIAVFLLVGLVGLYLGLCKNYWMHINKVWWEYWE